LKVLLVYNESAVEGKGNIDLFSVYRELKRLGHTPVIVARKDGKAQDGIYTIFPDPVKAFFALPSLIRVMAGIIRREKPDVIVAEGGWYIPVLVSLANRDRAPVVYVFRGLVLEVLVAFHAKSFIVRTGARLFVAINYRIFRKGRQHLVGTNTSICKFYREKLQRPVELIGTHLMDLARFRPAGEAERKDTRKNFSITLDGTAVLYSGAMEEWHLPYLADLAQAVAELAAEGKQIQLVVMGWGSCRDRFATELEGIRARTPGFSTVMLPFLQHEDVPKIIASCDICVDPLLRPYPMDHAPAGKLMEYMACGTCVVTTKGYSNEELVQDHRNGLLVDGSRPALLAALKELVENRHLVRSLGAAARETVTTYFASINKAAVLETYLQKIATAAKGR
jgi:glycosyltransferase involved in cell wall biosynthesis